MEMDQTCEDADSKGSRENRISGESSGYAMSYLSLFHCMGI